MLSNLVRWWARLKARLSTQLKEQPSVPEPRQRRRMTWMIAEDDSEIREVIETMCELWGFESISFKDGFQAIEYLSSNHLPSPIPDVALLDIRMPGPWGHEIGAKLRQHPTLNDIGIVLITASKLEGTDEERILLASGADRLLYKPLPVMDELLGLVTGVLERRKVCMDEFLPALNKPAEQRRDREERHGG